jgi:hypothetical protein
MEGISGPFTVDIRKAEKAESEAGRRRKEY